MKPSRVNGPEVNIFMTKVRVNVLPVNVKTGRIMNPVRVNRPDVIIWRRVNGLRVKIADRPKSENGLSVSL